MPLSATAVHPEGPRYRAALLFVPGLWAGAGVWSAVAGFLAHRGWEGFLVEPGETASLDARARDLAAFAAELERPVVLIAHDAAGLVALDVARRTAVAAVLWAAPLVPGSRAVRAVVSPWRVLAGLALAAPVPRPDRWLAGIAAPAWAKADEAPRPVIDVVRGRAHVTGASVPTALVVGTDDPLCGDTDRAWLARRLGADVVAVPGRGRSPLTGSPEWRQGAGLLHRWLVQRLGEDLLELHEEAMAERADAEPD